MSKKVLGHDGCLLSSLDRRGGPGKKQDTQCSCVCVCVCVSEQRNRRCAGKPALFLLRVNSNHVLLRHAQLLIHVMGTPNVLQQDEYYLDS